MAYTTYGNTVAASTNTLRDRLVARIDAFRVEAGKRRGYRKTFSELSALSNRDLAYLGISRSGIKAIALEAAYGK